MNVFQEFGGEVLRVKDWQSKQDAYAAISAKQSSGKDFAIVIVEGDEKIRSLTQNSALHKGLRILGSKLSDAGVDKREFFKEPFFFNWSLEDMKTMFKIISKAMGYPESTRKMTGKQIVECYDILNRKTSEVGVSSPFPSRDLM